MIEHVFQAEMMKEREKQLVRALLDCAGVCYDANFTQNKILGEPIQIIDGVQHRILDVIGKPKNCSWTEIVEYWADKMPEDEVEAYVRFSDIDRIKKCYENGETKLIHRFWTYDVMGNSMLAEQVMRLYKDCVTGDLLGLIYVTNAGEQYAMRKQYEEESDRRSFLETMALNLPGGYHRCSTDNGFILSFVSESFLDITGYTRQQLEDEIGNSYINLVAPEDREYFMSLEPELSKTGKIHCAYRIVRRDGSRRWVQDSTQYVEREGEEYYQCTLADIHDFVNNLNESKKKAEESSLAKSTFLFNASHDIRTPMNAISGFAHIIEQNADNPAIVKETVAKIKQSGKTLMTLLNDVLELSRIERGKDELNLEALSLNEHCQSLFDMFCLDMENKGINFSNEVNIIHSNVLCDPIKLSRIGMNFLSNAKKFTSCGGSVVFGIDEISSENTHARYRFYVKDTGIGMSKEFQERAFGQFERERSSTESGVSGSGLGLSIAKKIVDLMGGECIIKSELGKGTEISAILTLALVDEEKVKEKMSEVKSIDMSGKHILLVEDNEFNREIAKYILEDMNFIVDEAGNGLECIDMLIHADAPDYAAVLMDIQMPVMDGYTATMEIRNIDDKKISSIPIIAMTANAFEEDKKKCLSVGMNAHIGKPIEHDALMHELVKIIRCPEGE